VGRRAVPHRELSIRANVPAPRPDGWLTLQIAKIAREVISISIRNWKSPDIGSRRAAPATFTLSQAMAGQLPEGLRPATRLIQISPPDPEQGACRESLPSDDPIASQISGVTQARAMTFTPPVHIHSPGEHRRSSQVNAQ
jgi:hypothetical protein